jgi:predicted outer membrane repeat protein
MYSVESSPILTGCQFRDNEAGAQGGGVCLEDSNSVWIDCTFHANWSWDGGAVCIVEASDTRMTGCRFLGNGGHGLGGAVLDAGQNIEITNCVFSGNLAIVDGGALAVTGGSGVLANCTFNRNMAEGKQAGQALAVTDAVATLANCIFWDHVNTTPPQIAVANTALGNPLLIVSYCDVPGGEAEIMRKGAVTVTWGNGNLDANPGFKNPAGVDRVVGTEDDDLHLPPGSPCVDAGDNASVPTDVDDLNSNGNRLERVPFDLDGKPRFVDRPDVPDTGVADAPLYPWIVDLGAYELGK